MSGRCSQSKQTFSAANDDSVCALLLLKAKQARCRLLRNENLGYFSLAASCCCNVLFFLKGICLFLSLGF